MFERYRIPTLILAACTLVQALIFSAAAGDLIPRKTLFGNPERSAPFISPDGTKLAFTAAKDGVMNIWIAPVADINAAQVITSEKRRPIMEFQWAPNSTHVLYFQDRDGDENFHLYAVDIRSKETKDLTPYKSVRAKIIGKSSYTPDELLVGINNRNPHWHDVWMINIITGSAKLIEQNNQYAEYLADKSLTLRLASKPVSGGGITYFSKANGRWKKLFLVTGEDALNTEPLFISGNGKLAYFTDSRKRNTSALSAIDLKTGRTNIRAQSAKSDIDYVIKDHETGTPLAAGFEYDKMEWVAVDPSIAPDLAALKKAIPGFWFPLSLSKDTRLWTVWIDNPGKPIRFGLYDRKTKALTALFTARPNLEGTTLPRTSPHIIKSRDGLSLVSYLTLPHDLSFESAKKRREPLPLVLMVHGGPWARDSMAYNPYSAWLANRGYAVLSVNFRGSMGFGKAFVNAGDREWGGKMHDDLIDAVDWAVAQGIADPERVAIYGASYGGYAALVGLSMTPSKFACGVDIVGPSNLVTMLQNTPPYWQSFADTFKRRVGDPSTPKGKRFLESRSPLFHAQKIKRPLLIGQGANDPRVTQKEADQIVSAMQKNGLPVTYVLYADEGHGFARAQNRLSFNAVTEAFLADCLDSDAEPIGGDFEGSSISVPAGKEFIDDLDEALSELDR